jgi:2-C-methyl-D-erythritol 4-phosphate cytidylyltransferase
MAAGSGTRMGASLPKQFLEIGGKAILQHTIEAFLEASPGISVVTVLNPDYIDYWRNYCLKHNFTCPQITVAGGITRFHSVRNALDRIRDGAVVAVHDGVRPLVTAALISEMFEKTGDFTSALLYERKYRRCKDSLYKVNLSNVAKEVEQKYLAKHYKESYKLLRSRHIYMIVAYSFIFIAAIMLIIYTIRRFRKMIKKREIEIEEYREYITDAIEQKNELENRCKELEINSRTANSNNIPRFISLLHNRIRNLQSLTELAHIHQNNPGRFYSEFKEQLKVSKNTYTEFMDELYSMTDLSCNGIMTHLKNEYPDLTKYELSYCALICLGFSQESIRILMNHNNINSIYTLRTKIRKKMSIPAGDSVLEKHIRELVGRLVNNEMM